jgi:quercetin dioxygenase-like cupin family protein
MKLAYVSILAALAVPAAAQPPPAPVSTPVGQFDATLSGQPIRLPQGPVQVTVTETLIPAGASLPEHRHPHPRYIRVLAGRIAVKNLDTGETRELKTGDFAVEALQQWHTGQALGDEPVRLLVIDQTPPGEPNMQRR